VFFTVRALSDAETQALLDEFRRRPVAYVVDAPRLGRLPPAVREFLRDHYQWYFGPVYIPTFRLHPDRIDGGVNVHVSGPYRWFPSPDSTSAELYLGQASVAPGGTFALSAGQHEFQIRPAGATGTLVLAVSAPPGDEIFPFIDPVQLDRLYGVR